MTSRFDRIAQRDFVTSDDIRAVSLRGETALAPRENSTVTDEARELAMKLGVRLDVPGHAPAAQATSSPATRPSSPGPSASQDSVSARAPASVAMQTLSEDTGRRVAEAIAAVLSELKLGERAAAIAPVLTRRVIADLAKSAERKWT